MRTRLTELRREYGREQEPFDILLALLEPPTPDLYRARRRRRHHRGDVQAVAGHGQRRAGVERYREPIERFAENIIEKCR